MDEATARAAAQAAAHAFGARAGPVTRVRGGASPLYDVTLADARRLALRLHGPATDPRHVEDGARLSEALADAGLATPWPQRARDHALTVAVPGAVATALQWIPATSLKGAPDPAHLHAVGVLRADFHLTARAVAPRDLCLPDRRPTLPVIHDPALSHGADAARAALSALQDAPTGVVMDNPGAVLSGMDGLWLIGLERAGPGWPAQDLAAALWAHGDVPDLSTRRDALVAGYVAGGGNPRDALPDRIALCLSLRALHAAAAAPRDSTARARAVALAGGLPG